MILAYKNIIFENNNLEKKFKSLDFKIAVLSNTVTFQLNSILEHQLRRENIPALVKSGTYNNILQDSKNLKKNNAVVIFWDLSDFFDGLNYNIENLSEKNITDVKNKILLQIDYVFEQLKKTSLVIFNKFSSSLFSSSAIENSKFSKLAEELNNYILKKNYPNVKFVDIDKIFLKIGLEKSFNYNQYYLSKVLYTADFFKCYSKEISPLLLSLSGNSKKAIIFDCDNTLWKGIVSEDGFNEIEMSKHSFAGRVYNEIQSMAVKLSENGIFVCLCSKNNIDEVENVFAKHKDIVLKKKHLSIIKCNWKNKVSNIIEIAKELNIGLDSLVFVDDSDFEIGFVNNELKDVTTIKVPKKIEHYPNLLRENLKLFYNLSKTKEDKNKLRYIKQQKNREVEKKKYKNIDNYLNSLDIKIKTHINDKNNCERFSQMSQKTNQFNLTTLRYSQNDIINFIKSKKHDLIAINVSDAFGDNGITGLCIIKYISSSLRDAEILIFLMSCRIIGRKIEFHFMDQIIDFLKRKKIINIKAKFIRTKKNDIVSNFFEQCGFELISTGEKSKQYVLKIQNYKKLNKINIKIKK